MVEALKEQIETEKALLNTEILEYRRERDHLKASQVLKSLKLKKRIDEAKNCLKEAKANWTTEAQFAFNAIHVNYR